MYVYFSMLCLPKLLYSTKVLFVIASPDVYKSPNSDCYLVFGEAKVRYKPIISTQTRLLITFSLRSRMQMHNHSFPLLNTLPKAVASLMLLQRLRRPRQAVMTKKFPSSSLRKKKMRTLMKLVLIPKTSTLLYSKSTAREPRL